MASQVKHSKYSKADLEIEVTKVTDKKLTLRQAEAVYGVPQSTLSDYVSGKVKLGRCQGPPTVSSAEEEVKLAWWALEMAAIGYGRSKEQILLTVQKIVEKDQRPNPFKDGRPGKKWWRRVSGPHLHTTFHMVSIPQGYTSLHILSGNTVAGAAYKVALFQFQGC